MSSPNHDHLAHLKIPLQDILRATDNFDEENVICKSDFEKRYRRELSWAGEWILIHARSWLNEKRDDETEQEFWLKISMLSSLKHRNLVSLVGFCDENDEKIIIYRHHTRASLAKYLSDPMQLTWVRRLKICVGVANALSYIHHEETRDFSIIHRNIDSETVILNDNWDAKLSGFEFSMKVAASERHLSFHVDKVHNNPGYTDPTYIETKSAHHKSDIYSFGILMLELLCGRKALIDDDHQVNKYLAPLAITHYTEKTLSEIIEWDLWEQMDLHSFNIFAETAFDCLNDERSQRPNVDEIVPRLEKALQLQLEHQTVTSSLRDDLDHLKIPLEDIESATNFSKKNEIFSYRHCYEYKGQLLWCGDLIDISARAFNTTYWLANIEQKFWMEVSMLYSLKHKNVVSLIGFCDENDKKITVYRHHRALNNYLNDPMSLTWVRRLEICISLAHALSYIYYDEQRDFSVIHRKMRSSNVQLDDAWKPKLCDFEYSMKIESSQRHNSFHTNTLEYVKGYGDPTYIKTKKVSHKSDIYSFGVVLLELLFGRESVNEHDPDNKYLANVASFYYREKTLYDIIDPDLWKQMDPHSCYVFAEIAYNCLNEERSQRPNIHETVKKLEIALELQLEHENLGSETSISTRGESQVSKNTKSFLKDLSHLKLSDQESDSLLDNIHKENVNEGARILKSRLLRSGQFIDVFLHVYQCDFIKDESKKFWMELSMLSSLKHKNLVSLIGFYDGKEVDMKVIIYKREANGSLKDNLIDETLTWTQRLKICTDVAKALSYIHYDAGRDFSVIHCNIKSSTIQLDDKWEPKLSGFGLSLKTTVSRRHRLLLTRDILENAYLDPKYKKTDGLTHKSDVYSFGVVLFEVLCGRSARRAVDKDEDSGDDDDECDVEDGDNEKDDDDESGLLGKLAKSHLDDMIMPHVQKQMDPESFKIVSDTAYWCIKEDRADRPYIDQVVKRLEQALELQRKHENPVKLTSSNQFEGKNLEHLKIGLNDINEATNNFDDAYCIGTGGFGKVYKAVLEHFDRSDCSSIEVVDKCDLPRKRSTVAIKRIYNHNGEQGFIAEVETLTSCKHENIISLIGFCYEGTRAMILVYEHASKGSLESYLGSNDKMNLSWVQRLNICLDTAHGLNYIHNNTDQRKQKMIHRDIKSDNILLGDNWEAKIADFGLSKFHPANQETSTIYTDTVAGTYVYLDPEYEKYGRLNKKSDIYSFGVVLLEILAGRLAYDSLYTNVNENGITPIARDHFKNGTIGKIVDQKIKDETDENFFSLRKGPNKESLDIFVAIAIRCVAQTQAPRPTIDIVIKQLKKAINFQENHKDSLKLSLEDVKLATQDFSQVNIIGSGYFGKIYKGEVTHAHVQNIAAKRLDKRNAEREAQFATELEILMEYKHENVNGLVGYCNEEEEKIIVCQYASRGSLDKYLSDDSLTWVMRLRICIDIATGLEFLHGGVSSQEIVIHRDINSSNILLFNDWVAKISDFGLSLVSETEPVGGLEGARPPLTVAGLPVVKWFSEKNIVLEGAGSVVISKISWGVGSIIQISPSVLFQSSKGLEVNDLEIL